MKQWKKVDIALDTKKLRRFAKFFNRKRASGFVTLLRETNVDKILDEQQRREQFHFTVYLSTDGTELKVMNKAGHPIFLMNGKREATIFLKKLDKKYLQSSLHAMMNTKNMAHRLCFKVPKGMVGTPQKMFYRIIDLVLYHYAISFNFLYFLIHNINRKSLISFNSFSCSYSFKHIRKSNMPYTGHDYSQLMLAKLLPVPRFQILSCKVPECYYRL